METIETTLETAKAMDGRSAKDVRIGIDLPGSRKLMPETTIADLISEREIFESEREECSKFRLVATITPYCTNVLCNPLTEILEWNSNGTVRRITGNARSESVSNTGKYAYPKAPKSGTEYEFRPGMDIFDNHLLRSKVFRVVNKGSGDDFNTLGDLLRDASGSIQTFVRRDTPTGDSPKENMHLYLKDEVLTFDESIDANRWESQGWLGFTNNTTIKGRKRNQGNYDDMGIGRVLNDHGACEFIDLFPGRSLFSFVPQYHTKKGKTERNWNFLLTYPSENSYNHPLVASLTDGTRGLLMMKAEFTINEDTRQYSLNLTSFVPHNLDAGDFIEVYYSSNGKYFSKFESLFQVEYLGSGDMEQYQIVASTSLNILAAVDRWDDLYQANRDLSIRIVKISEGVPCEYYFRVHSKLPNTKFLNKDLSDDCCETPEKLASFIEQTKMVDDAYNFAREDYRLGFAKSIYGDDVAQVTYTDTIDTAHLKDNLGRPLTTAYFTIIKNNRGWDQWYAKSKLSIDEFDEACAFGRLSAGVEMIEDDKGTISSRAQYSDAHVINNCGEAGSMSVDEYLWGGNGGITAEDSKFVGDLVEYSPAECAETVLSPIAYRFNTNQRECSGTQSAVGDFVTHEIKFDDYDVWGTSSAERGFLMEECVTTDNDEYKYPEGYIYNPHYAFHIGEFDQVEQAYHREIQVLSCKPIQDGEVCIRIATKTRSKVDAGDTIRITEPYTGDYWDTSVISVLGTHSFTIIPPSRLYDESSNPPNWIKFCESMNDDDPSAHYKINVVNKDIPSYAALVGDNTYLWRPVRHVGDMLNAICPEYPFANGHFYVNLPIDFYLRRQDPFGRNFGTSKESMPSDLPGIAEKENDKDYKGENEDKSVC